MSADTLSVKARGFYEYTKGKLVITIILGAGMMAVMGQMCYFVAKTQEANWTLDNQDDQFSNTLEDAYSDKSAGNGFAAFFLIIGSIFLWAMAIYYSPVLMCATPNEKETLKVPMEDVYARDDSPQV